MANCLVILVSERSAYFDKNYFLILLSDNNSHKVAIKGGEI